MKTINQLSLKCLTIGGALCALLLLGCGGGGGGTTAVNEGKAVNALGFYGEGVKFGSQLILGTWQVNKEYRTFKNDGTVTIDYFGSGRVTGVPYGLNAKGTELTIDFSAYYQDIEKITITTEKGDCLDAILFKDFIDNREAPDENSSTLYCKRNPSATLEPISNAGKATNAYGYYGEGVKFGNDLVVGNWGSVILDNTGSEDGDIRISFDINGSCIYVESNPYGTNYATTVDYGISEDGKMVYSLYDNFEIIGLFEGCYLMKNQYNQEHKLCKMENNDTSWVVSPSYP